MIARRDGWVTVEVMESTKASGRGKSENKAKTKPKRGGEKPGGGQDYTHLLPRRISPSRASDYEQCPKLFYYKTLLGLSTPATVDTCKGTLAHHAFEKIFDHPREERTADNAVPYVRQHWAELTQKPDYAAILGLGETAVESMLVQAEDLVRQWFSVERPHNFDPEERELYVKAHAAGVEVHGFIDRLDKVVREDGSVLWYISDYKTGKPAREPYLEKAFFAMNVYALLVHKMLGIKVSKLRLIYVKNGSKDDVVSQLVSDHTLDRTERELKRIWAGIVRMAKNGEYPTRKGVLCNWCHFKDGCPAWATELANMPIENRDGELYPR